MANWLLEKLKKLVDIKINLNDVDIFNINIHITKNSNNNPTYLDEKKNTLHIDIDKITPQQHKVLKEITNKNIQEGSYLLESESAELLDKLYAFNRSDDSDKKHLKFFKDIINREDYLALELSYFLRKELLAGSNEIHKYKSEIRHQYGKRGGHIANLCTAGYFENLLMPLYNYSKESFNEIYNLIVDKEALTLFIHGRMKQKEVVSTLKNKVELAKTYGLNNFYIHCRGKLNIKTINKCINEFQETYGAIHKVEKTIEKLEILVIQIILK